MRKRVLEIYALLSLTTLSSNEFIENPSTLIFDINGDGQNDIATIYIDKSEEEVTHLNIYLSENRTTLRKVIDIDNLVWGSSTPGQEPYLSYEFNNSFSIISNNMSVGRYKWEEVLRVQYIGKEFYVTNYDYSYYDVLDINSSGDCSINLFSGEGQRNRADVNTTFRKEPLQNWNSDKVIQFCIYGDKK